MPNTKADYFLEELNDWKKAIGFYKEEIQAFTSRLEAVISRNSIPHIAEKVELFQEKLNKSTDSFYRIQIEIEQLETMLATDHMPVDNTQLSEETEKRQLLLRHNMLVAEQAYLGSKYDCYDFLAATLKK